MLYILLITALYHDCFNAHFISNTQLCLSKMFMVNILGLSGGSVTLLNLQMYHQTYITVSAV